VFARTQRGASRMAEQLREAGVMAGALHGGLTQGARARVLAAFKDGSLPVLVATDVAARGIDVDDVTLVLQVDPPMNFKDYLHRSGRTAR
ncbi:helicase-related protein, partial [Collinsella aerofaciens]